MPARFRFRLGLLLVGLAAPMFLKAGQTPDLPSFARRVVPHVGCPRASALQLEPPPGIHETANARPGEGQAFGAS